MTEEQEFRLARLAALGDAPALERLVLAHMRLVFAMASQFVVHGVSLDELVSEGCIALIHACRRFDPERGPRLGGYAAQWIRVYLRRYTLANRRIVRTPSTRAARTVLAQLHRVQRELAQRRGRPPESSDIARELGVAKRDVDEIVAALSARDVPYGVARNDRSFEVAADQPSPEANAMAAERQRFLEQQVQHALRCLSERDRRIVAQRCMGDSTLGELSAELGISRERVRQLEVRAKGVLGAVLDPRVLRAG